MNTVFDRIIAKQVPCDQVYEDEHVLAFRDIRPTAPVHVLVIPKVKFTSFAAFAEADPATLGAYLKGIARVAAHLGLDTSGYRVVFNHGDDAQQTVAYVHAHILGGRPLSWPAG